VLAQDAATKNYVESNSIPKSTFVTATGTFGASGVEQTLVTFPSGKTPLNGKIIILEMWVERTVGEWFSISGQYLGAQFTSISNYYKSSTNSMIGYYTAQPSAGWTKKCRLDYLEL